MSLLSCHMLCDNLLFCEQSSNFSIHPQTSFCLWLSNVQAPPLVCPLLPYLAKSFIKLVKEIISQWLFFCTMNITSCIVTSIIIHTKLLNILLLLLDRKLINLSPLVVLFSQHFLFSPSSLLYPLENNTTNVLSSIASQCIS